MTPTLVGRWQTRLFLLGTIGLAVTLIFGRILNDYTTPLAALGYVLVIGFVLNVLGVFGAGDAKFAAAAAPFVMVGDLDLLGWIFIACVLAGYVTHRIAKHSPLRRLVPDWESWTSGRRFPMGLPLGMTLVTYLFLAATQSPV